MLYGVNCDAEAMMRDINNPYLGLERTEEPRRNTMSDQPRNSPQGSIDGGEIRVVKKVPGVINTISADEESKVLSERSPIISGRKLQTVTTYQQIVESEDESRSSMVESSFSGNSSEVERRKKLK